MKTSNKPKRNGKEFKWGVDAIAFKTLKGITRLLTWGIIVDWGSNENGHYMTFGNGWMICTHVLNSTSTEQEEHGALYFIRYGGWTFPQPFIERPHVEEGVITNETQITAHRSVSTNGVSDFYGYRGTNFNVSGIPIQQISVMAIGRWK